MVKHICKGNCSRLSHIIIGPPFHALVSVTHDHVISLCRRSQRAVLPKRRMICGRSWRRQHKRRCRRKRNQNINRDGCLRLLCPRSNRRNCPFGKQSRTGEEHPMMCVANGRDLWEPSVKVIGKCSLHEDRAFLYVYICVYIILGTRDSNFVPHHKGQELSKAFHISREPRTMPRELQI